MRDGIMRRDLSNAFLSLILTSYTFRPFMDILLFKMGQTFHLPVFAMSEELISHISFLSIFFFHENFGVTFPIHEHVRFNNFFKVDLILFCCFD